MLVNLFRAQCTQGFNSSVAGARLKQLTSERSIAQGQSKVEDNFI